MSDEFGLISIIMAAYNAEKTIEAAIESVMKQTYHKFELLVIDDNSRDHTADIIEKFAATDARISFIHNAKNSGVSYSRKCGLDNAKGEWIAILDSDDIWASDKLEKQIYLQNKKNADLLYTGSSFIDQNGNALNGYLQAIEQVEYKQLLKQNILSNSSVLVRRNLYQENYAVGDNMHEDFAVWLKILKKGYIAYGLDEPLLIYRLSKSSKTGNKLKSAKMNWNTYRYVGLNIFQRMYYQCHYIINGLLKYRGLTEKKHD